MDGETKLRANLVLLHRVEDRGSLTSATLWNDKQAGGIRRGPKVNRNYDEAGDVTDHSTPEKSRGDIFLYESDDVAIEECIIADDERHLMEKLATEDDYRVGATEKLRLSVNKRSYGVHSPSKYARLQVDWRDIAHPIVTRKRPLVSQGLKNLHIQERCIQSAGPTQVDN